MEIALRILVSFEFRRLHRRGYQAIEINNLDYSQSSVEGSVTLYHEPIGVPVSDADGYEVLGPGFASSSGDLVQFRILLKRAEPHVPGSGADRLGQPHISGQSSS